MKRTLTHPTDIHPRMEYLLHEWGEWECSLHEGFGNVSSSMKIIMSDVQEDFKSKVFGFKEPQYNEAASRFSDAINRLLEKTSPEQADALRVLYVAPTRFRQMLFEERNVTKRTIFYRARAAKRWLTHWMEHEPFFKQYYPWQ